MHVIFLDLTHVSEKVNKVRYADFILFWQNLQIEMADQRFRWIFIIEYKKSSYEYKLDLHRIFIVIPKSYLYSFL